ncbi:MAG: HD domain-containing protein [Thermodesulfovibrionales bacterium]|nr:HD domain-containing protein [Thermodesulfovibrionales bacterium]
MKELEELSSLRKDLELTVKELSESYEELSLLYKITSELIGLDVNEIAEKVLSLAERIFGYKNSVILFFDMDKNLYIKAWRGDIDLEEIMKEKNLIEKALRDKKTRAFCKISDGQKQEVSMLISPLIGKKSDIGALIIIQKPSKEFFANEIKLMNTLASHAGLFIENTIISSELEELLTGSINCLIKALEASSPWTAGHTERVVHYAMAIGRELNLSRKELERLKIASLLHDIGKIGVPDYILNKPGKLDEDESVIIKGHTMKAEEILLSLKPCGDIIREIKYHHERWDGKGFYGLKGETIPLIARIIAVADAFDAMTTDRPYRKRLSFEQAASEIEKAEGSQFDPEVVRAFLRWFSQQHQASLF